MSALFMDHYCGMQLKCFSWQHKRVGFTSYFMSILLFFFLLLHSWLKEQLEARQQLAEIQLRRGG